MLSRVALVPAEEFVDVVATRDLRFPATACLISTDGGRLSLCAHRLKLCRKLTDPVSARHHGSPVIGRLRAKTRQDLEDALAKLTLEAVHSVDDLHLWDKSDLVSCLPRTTAIKIYKAVAGSVHMASVHVDSDTTR